MCSLGTPRNEKAYSTALVFGSDCGSLERNPPASTRVIRRSPEPLVLHQQRSARSALHHVERRREQKGRSNISPGAVRHAEGERRDGPPTTFLRACSRSFPIPVS
jgi:hypothetical protein